MHRFLLAQRGVGYVLAQASDGHTPSDAGKRSVCFSAPASETQVGCMSDIIFLHGAIWNGFLYSEKGNRASRPA